MSNNVERHKKICEELNHTYKIKNEAYGDSFSKQFQELGIMSSVVRLSDKYNRFKALAQGTDNKVQDESIKDTLLDMANYAIMTYMELEE